jgi:outer membrane protein assembly factor BamB
MFRGPDASGVSQGECSWALASPSPVSTAPLLDRDQRERRPACVPEPAGIGKTLWKTAVPGLSHSSPIVWADTLYVATALSSAGEAPLRVGLYGDGDSAQDNGEQSWRVYALDKRTGRVRWMTEAVKAVPKTRRHTKATHANTTLATDGAYLAAWFGSEGVHVYDLNGKLLWKKDLGVFDVGPQGYDLQWGVASSPVLYDGTLILQCDQKIGSFLVALAARDGKELWRTPRDGVSNHSWATPAVVTLAGVRQIVTNGWPFIAAYDFATGRERWRQKAGGDIPVPTPVTGHGLIYVTNSHGGSAPLYAFRPDGTLAWTEPRNGAYMQTPLVAGDYLYSCSDRGILKVFDARTGQLLYQQRLGEGTAGFSSSPVLAGGRLYFASEEGDLYVVRPGPRFALLATGKTGEITMATPAYSQGVLFYRTRGHVLALAQ